MKKILLLLVLFASIEASAQQYKKFFFAFDLGTPNERSILISSITMEPSYRISDKVAVGFRMEQLIALSMIGGGDNRSLGSMGINAHHYFQLSSVRVFGGLGVGLFNPSNNFIMYNTDTKNQRDGIGIYPRIGLEAGHFRLMMEYNFIQPMKYYMATDNPGAVGHYENLNQSYFSLKLGFFFGGGKRKTR